MERFNSDNEIVLLFNQYDSDSEYLHTSFKNANIPCKAVVIDDDGFLPEDVTSVYGYYLGDFKNKEGSLKRPRYFNEIKIPDYWEISANNSNGKISNLNHERGRIYYKAQDGLRQVKVIDWMDEEGTVRLCEHFNGYGDLYAKTTFNKKGQKFNKCFFDINGKEMIVENYVTGDIILNADNKTKIFRNRTAFVADFMQRMGYDEKQICYNSLATPFFVSELLKPGMKKDVLFWQENRRDDIPGNMQFILGGNSKRTAKILVQKRKSFEKLMELSNHHPMLEKCGNVYSFVRENTYSSNALICTNSDNIEHLKEMVEGLKNVDFHIAALTEMSSKLMGYGKYENVHLYPGVKNSVLSELFRNCDLYFDINHEGEICNAVAQAFINQQLIYGFKETMHNTNLIADEHLYSSNQVVQMIEDIKKVLNNRKTYQMKLEIQMVAGGFETIEAFKMHL